MTVSLLSTLDKDVLTSDIYQEALRHRSAGTGHNERLEYLGDAILGMIIAEYLYREQPEADEGDLSRLRAYLVRKETLAEIAKENNLGDAMILGPGELKSGGYRRSAILADAMEAVIGAVYLCKGLTYVRDFIHTLYKTRFDTLPLPLELKDPKSHLQEYLQSRGMPLPEYVVTAEGEPHAQKFKAYCRISGSDIEGRGVGSSKRKAEQDSARQALSLLNNIHAS